jgi:peptidoglycan/LPS O-acetylase OafA/YrhL
VSTRAGSGRAADRLPNFDFLRLFLALGVVLYHAPLLVKDLKPFTVWVNYVPAFLAVSGFLVLQSFETSKSWKEFAAKRCWRLLPALGFNLLVITIWIGWDVGLSSIVQWLTGGHVELPPFSNGVLWSLGYEEVFYAFLAILYILGGYNRPWIVWILLLIGTVFSFWSDERSQFVSDRVHLVPAFFAGNLLYIYRAKLSVAGPWVPTGMLLAALTVKHIWFEYSQTTIFNLLLPPIYIWWAFAGAQIPLPKWWPDLSYGVYLWHLPAIWFLQLDSRFMFPHNAWTLVILALVAAAISWFAVEVPFKMLRRWLINNRRAAGTPARVEENSRLI